MSQRESASPYPTSLAELLVGIGRETLDAVAIFDFDGVLSHPEEERVYRLSEWTGERERLRIAALHYRIDSSFFDLNYCRHLVFQAIQLERAILPRPGPLLELARDMTARSSPFFILTARSGPAAVRRVLEFLSNQQISPQEIFFVGRVPKGRQLALVKETTGTSKIWYFEDSLRHIRNSRNQAIDGMKTVPVSVAGETGDAFALWCEALAWFERTHVSKKAA